MFEEINWALVAPIFVIQLILQIIAIVDLVRNDEPRGPKPMWAIIIIVGSLLGPVAYFIFGRRQ